MDFRSFEKVAETFRFNNDQSVFRLLQKKDYKNVTTHWAHV